MVQNLNLSFYIKTDTMVIFFLWNLKNAHDGL